MHDNTASNSHPLLLAARKLRWQTVLKASEFDKTQGGFDAFFGLWLWDVGHFEAKIDILPNGEVGKQGEVLKNGANHALVGRNIGYVDAV